VTQYEQELLTALKRALNCRETAGRKEAREGMGHLAYTSTLKTETVRSHETYAKFALLDITSERRALFINAITCVSSAEGNKTKQERRYKECTRPKICYGNSRPIQRY
jgi:hypothetical protein